MGAQVFLNAGFILIFSEGQVSVHRSFRLSGLLPGEVADSKLDLENYAPLDILEKSLEMNDGKGDNEVNGTKKINDKDIEYYHKKNQGEWTHNFRSSFHKPISKHEHCLSSKFLRRFFSLNIDFINSYYPERLNQLEQEL